MVQRWSVDARYSHGPLVPLFAVALLYLRRKELPDASALRPNAALGIGLVLLGGLVQLVGGYVGSPWVVGLSLLPYLLGVSALVGGLPALRWALPAVLFLVFMIPLPYRFEVLLGPPLQALATKLSTFALQTIGLMAFARGNIIRLGEFRIGVVEACSGLSMLMTFVALSVGVALLVKRPWLDRIMLVVAAAPVALAANTARIVLTGVLYVKAGSAAAEHFYHDLAGWLMIPFALALLWLMAKVWSWLVVEDESAEKIPIVVGLAGTKPASTPARASASRGARRSAVMQDAVPVVLRSAPRSRRR
jgi:exosortase